MHSIRWLLLVLLVTLSCTTIDHNAIYETTTRVEARTLISESLPPTRIQVSDPFDYIGYFPFDIDGVAGGVRHIFVDRNAEKIDRMFIAQFERFYPSNDETYRYRFDTALVLGNLKFKHNTFAYRNSEVISQNPTREAALTARFLEDKGFVLEDQLMISRYVTLGNPDRKSELILFYCENVSSSGHQIDELYTNDEETPLWKTLSAELHERALASFTVLE